MPADELLQKYLQTQDYTEKVILVEQLYMEYENYIRSLVKSTVKFSTSLEYEDFVSAAKEGFFVALNSYNPSDKSFVSHMSAYIKKYVYKAIYEEDRPVRIPQYLWSAVKETEEEKNGCCDERVKQIAARHNINENCLKSAILIVESSFCTLDDNTEELFYNPFEDSKADECIDEGEYDYCLTRQEQEVMRYLVDDNGKVRTAKELADCLDISVKGADKLKKNCIRKISLARA